jgi:lipopolysaccharide assembly protein A
MRFIAYVAFVLFTLLCIIVALSNGTSVVFSLYPLPFEQEMPVFMLFFIGVFVGLFGGWVVSILSGIRHARRHRTAAKKIQDLEKQLKNHISPQN